MLGPIPKIGLVGAGGVSTSHLPHLLRLGAEVVVYSTSGAADLVARYGGTVVDSFDRLLAQVDCVDVATPTHTHYEYVQKALLAGKDVIAEKPLARTTDQAEELVALASAMGRELYPAHVLRYFPEYRALHDAVIAGHVGDLAVLRFSRAGASPARIPWFGDRALSGGVVMDQMLHDIDLARWIAGEVVTVSAVHRRGRDAEPVVEAAEVLLTHASGAISHIAGYWGPPQLKFTTSFAVAGTAATLKHSSSAQQNYVADLGADRSGGSLIPFVDPDVDPYFFQFQAFIEALSGGESPLVSAADGVEAVRLTNAALHSIDVGQPVNIQAI